MLKLRPEGYTGHSSGVNKDRCKGPRWEGAANSPVQSKQSVTLTGRRGPWGKQAQLTQARGFRSRASRQPGLHSPQIPPRPHPPCHCSTPHVVRNPENIRSIPGYGLSRGRSGKGEPTCQCLMQETQETWVRSLGQEDSLEKGTAIHSSILDWRIPWTVEPGKLQSMGSQRVGHD